MQMTKDTLSLKQGLIEREGMQLIHKSVTIFSNTKLREILKSRYTSPVVACPLSL